MSESRKRFESYSDRDGSFVPANACKRCEKWFPPYMCPVSAEDVGVYCWGHKIEDAVANATADLKRQRDTLRTALIEAQWLLVGHRSAHGSAESHAGSADALMDPAGQLWRERRDVSLTRIRLALEASK